MNNGQIRKVSVFGSSLPNPGSEDYGEALKLGRLLGGAGYAVLTGGYAGTMEAVSRGAAESGGHVIGITCQEIEDWRGSRANPWVKEIIHKNTLLDRINQLIHACDAAIGLPGGIGTLAEIVILWNLIQIERFKPKLLIVIGEGWKTLLAGFYASQSAYIPQSNREIILPVPTVEDAFRVIENGRVG